MFLALACTFGLPQVAHSAAAMRLTNNSASSTSPAIAWGPNGRYSVAWSDTRDGNAEIYYATVDASGNRLGPDVRVTNTAASSLYPKLGVDAQGYVYLCWKESNNVWIAKLDWQGNPQVAPKLVNVGSYVVFMNPDISVLPGGGCGVGFGARTGLSNWPWVVNFDSSLTQICKTTGLYDNVTATGAAPVSLTCSGTYACTLTWYREGLFDEALSSISTTGTCSHGGPADACSGTSFPNMNRHGLGIVYERSNHIYLTSGSGCGIQLSENPGPSISPTVAILGTTSSIVVWDDRRNGNADLYYATYGNAFTKIGADAALVTGPSNSTIPAVASDGQSSAIIAWQDDRDGNNEIYLTYVGPPRAPVVVAPLSQVVSEGSLLTFTVTASDPDGDAIASLTAAGTAINAGAAFAAAGGNASGTFSWTPSLGQAGSYSVTFTASNTLSGTATTTTQVDPSFLTIAATAGPGGTISPIGAISVPYGQGQTFAMTPDLGYHITDVLVDGTSVGAVASYPFSGVIANHTIAAAFAINTYTITAAAGVGGSIDPSGAVTVNYGGSQTFTIAHDDCHSTADATVDGVSLGPVTSITISDVTANHTIVANFAFTDQRPGDADGDGLLDEWETVGIEIGSGGRYLLPGADPQHKDLYVEVDAMTGHSPDPAALRDVIGAFNQARTVCNPDGTPGVKLHIVGAGCSDCVDEANLPANDWPAYPDEQGIWNAFHLLKGAYFGTLAERGNLPLLTAKQMAFRYCIFGKSIGKPSGIAEGIGADFVVAHDPSWFNGISRDKWAGTFMHELGHSLGLHHGGTDGTTRDTTNGKPNYYSVMNYLWQWPVTVNIEGVDALSPYRSSWRLNYSESPLNDLDEASLNEPVGMGGDPDVVVPVGPPQINPITLSKWFRFAHLGGHVDWNRDGKPDDFGVQLDINNFGWPGEPVVLGDTLKGRDDWRNLKYGPLEGFPPPVAALAFAMDLTESDHEMTQAIFDSLSAIHIDCNGNEIEDAEEIAALTVEDFNGNGIPDPCEAPAFLTAVGEALPTRASLALDIVPFGSAHEIRYSLPVSAPTSLRVFDVKGRLVATLADGDSRAGTHRVVWNQVDAGGLGVSSGVYFVELRSGGRRAGGKIVVLR